MLMHPTADLTRLLNCLSSLERRQIRTYSAEDVLDLLSSLDQKPTLNHLIKFQKQRALEGAEKPEPESKERTMTVLRFTEGLGLTEAGIRVF